MHDDAVATARAMALTALLALTLVACGDSDDGGDSAEAERTTTSTTAVSEPGAEPTCEDGALGSRPYILCTSGDTADQGLVVALHGRGSSAQEMQATTQLEQDAAGEGLAVVFPESLDGGWGDDTFTTPTRPSGDEDVSFLDELVASLRADPRIDDDQAVGVVGFSNGASMALRYAVERPDDVRAVVAVAGQLPRDPAVRPAQPVPLLEVYGTGDPVRSYDAGIPDDPARQPGDPTPTLPTVETVAAFVATVDSPEHEGPVEADPDPADGTRLRSERWTGADGTVVVLRSVVDGGHTWPSANPSVPPREDFGPVSQDLDASAEAIAFILDPASVRRARAGG
jgi:polyhydroxybutyrate depolymerase